MHSFDWNDLRYFLAIHRQRTLAGAARSLRVQHSTVGRRLGGLENTLGASLFTQTPDGFVLTDAGREILPLAEEAERALTAIERRVAGSDERVEGVVRLTTSEAFSGFLVRHLSELRRRHPDLLVEVLAGNRSLDLARGEADVALRISATTQPELICKRIGDAAWSLYASEGYLARHGKPVSPTDLAGHEIIGFDESLSATPGAQWFAEHAASARIMLRGNSIPAVINAAIVGLGLAMVPCFLADAEPTLRRVTPDVLGSREIWLVFHPDVARIARVRRVIDFVTEIIGRAAPQLRGEALGRLAPTPPTLGYPVRRSAGHAAGAFFDQVCRFRHRQHQEDGIASLVDVVLWRSPRNRGRPCRAEAGSGRVGRPRRRLPGRLPRCHPHQPDAATLAIVGRASIYFACIPKRLVALPACPLQPGGHDDAAEARA